MQLSGTIFFFFFVFHSSFNDKPVNEDFVGPIGRVLFEKEQDDLLTDLINIPKKACDRRVCHPFSYFMLSVFDPLNTFMSFRLTIFA